ncbi:MAG: hypothetical protein EDM05_68525 [Leptolyngbya sp. IPPAS B-1204]
MPQTELVEQTVKRLTLGDHQPDPAELTALTTQMALDGELVMQGGSGDQQGEFICYHPPFYGAEFKLAERLALLLSEPLSVDLPRVQRWIDRFTEKPGFPF